MSHVHEKAKQGRCKGTRELTLVIRPPGDLKHAAGLCM